MEQFPQIWTERRKLKKTRNKNFYKINSTAKNTECSQRKMHRYLYKESCLKNSSSKNIHWLYIQFAKKIKQEVNIEGKVIFLSLKIWMHCEMVVLIFATLFCFFFGLKNGRGSYSKCMKFFYFWSQFVESKTPWNKSELLRKQKWKQRLQKLHLKAWFYHRQHACIKHKQQCTSNCELTTKSVGWKYSTCFTRSSKSTCYY